MDAPALTTGNSGRAGGGARVTLRMFAAARQEAGTGSATLEGAMVADVIAAAADRYGQAWAQVASSSRVWVNGEPGDAATPLRDGDEVAILPPVSGGEG